ncbi:MAG: DUF2236 domain-containing protein [Saprospirales bacterium]|nr:DUF2236 domain-containing protein [Saprospirales bacterium]
MKSPNPLWTPFFLEEKRKHTDPLGDRVAGQVAGHHQQEELKEFYKMFVLPHHMDYEALPPFLRDYFEETATLPTWADREKIRLGESVFRRHGILASMLLLAKALPECYSSWRGAKVLFDTGRMTGVDHEIRYTRRLMETSQFVINVMSAGGLMPEGVGLVTAQKIRLIHGSIRFYIRKQGGWDAKSLGEPINQEDMAGTFLSFSALVLEGMAQLGIDLTQEEKEAYIHCWAVVGYIVGLDEDLIPYTLEEATWLGHTILDRQKGPSEEGKILTKASLQFMETHMPLKFLFGSVPAAMVRFLIGEEIAGYLGVNPPRNPVTWLTYRLLPRVFAHKDGLHPARLLGKLLEHFKMRLMRGLIRQYNDYKDVDFYIPPSLREDWDL